MKTRYANIKELSSDLPTGGGICYFASPQSAGDTYRLCAFHHALEAKYKSKITLIIKPSHEAVVELFELKYIICDDDKFDIFGTLECLNLPNVVSLPSPNKIYSHFINYALNIYTNSQVEFDRRRLMLENTAQRALPTNLPKIDEDLKARLKKIAPLDKIILFAPEANSYPLLPLFIFKRECERLFKLGFSVIINIQKDERYRIDGVWDLNLSLKQAIALAINCAGVISTRSGFCDIIAPHCKNLTIFYTRFDDYILWDEALPRVKRIFIKDLNYYKYYLENRRSILENSLPFKLFQRYAVKGFWRRLRTPFTLHFKIYKNFKPNLAENSKEKLQNEILAEFTQSYEFQLGLLLQNACEHFWRGGFFVFIFKYLKLRKRKRNLARLSEIL